MASKKYDVDRLIAQHEQLCADLSEDNLKNLQKLADELDIPTSGKKKDELCNDIAIMVQKIYAVNAYNWSPPEEEDE